jgi:hypothetical protein
VPWEKQAPGMGAPFMGQGTRRACVVVHQSRRAVREMAQEEHRWGQLEPGSTGRALGSP